MTIFLTRPAYRVSDENKSSVFSQYKNLNCFFRCLVTKFVESQYFVEVGSFVEFVERAGICGKCLNNQFSIAKGFLRVEVRIECDRRS